MAIDRITTGAVLDGAIATADIADNAVTSEKIGANQVGTTEVADDAITGAKIENNPTIAGNLTVSGNTAASGDLTVDGNTLHVDASNNKVGLGVDPGTMPSFITHAALVPNGGGIGISSSSAGDNRYIYFGTGTSSSDVQLAAIQNTNSDLIFKGASGVEKLKINASGLAQFKSSGISAGNQVLQVIDDGATLFQIRAEDGNISFPQAGGGIYLGVTAGNAANLLNDYEEGTFTPTLIDSGDDLSPNYTFQAGQYTKVGNKVTFALRINSNSHDSDGDQLYVAGLPFAVNFTNTSNRSYVPVDGSGLNLDAGSGYYKLVGQLTNTNQSITLLQQGDLVVQNNFRANDLSQTKEIYISGTYFTNS